MVNVAGCAVSKFSIPVASVKAQAGHEQHGKMDMTAKALSLEKIHSGHKR